MRINVPNGGRQYSAKVGKELQFGRTKMMKVFYKQSISTDNSGSLLQSSTSKANLLRMCEVDTLN
jgi:hypothetical protein